MHTRAQSKSFAPPPQFAATALITDHALRDAAARAPEQFWAEQAAQLQWERPFEDVLDWQPPHARWFVGGALNASVNCLDRHVHAGHADQVAYHWEGEPGDRRTITYGELLDDVCRLADGLRKLGVRRGDRVAIYLPMIPELPTAMLACARLGATHSVVFAGFSSDALRDRINDAGARVLVTADGAFRRGKELPLKTAADAALVQCPTVEHCVVVQRTGGSVEMHRPRDVRYSDILGSRGVQVEPVAADADELLFLLYTSGTTAQPKGICHATGGYLVHTAYTHRTVFDLQPDSVYWCAADIGWVTGHSYIVYGPLANRTTSVLFEGTPDHPARDRFWEIVERYGVTILYTAPTAIRAFMKWGSELPAGHDLSSLRLLGSVGEPINPEAWLWYHRHIGSERCPIVDTWWQTETGGIMVAPLPGVDVAKPGSAGRPLPGVQVEVVDDAGVPVERGESGYVTISQPWPGMLRGIWGDETRFQETYFSRFPGRYFAGDGARLDEDGDLWFTGRIDDVMNVSGHRISTAEVESALVSHAAVAEAAVVGAVDADTGQAISAYVTLRDGHAAGPALAEVLRRHVADVIGPIARPRTVVIADDLPKTRSGKIMRRLLRDLAEGRPAGDTSTPADPSILEQLAARPATPRAAAPSEDVHSVIRERSRDDTRSLP